MISVNSKWVHDWILFLEEEFITGQSIIDLPSQLLLPIISAWPKTTFLLLLLLHQNELLCLLSTATSPVQFRSVKCQRKSPQNNNLKGKHTIENTVIMCYESCSQTVRSSSPSCSSALVSWQWEECNELEFQAICLSQELFCLFCCNEENVMGFWGSSSKLQAPSFLLCLSNKLFHLSVCYSKKE